MTFKNFLQSKVAGWFVVILIFAMIYFVQKCQGENFHNRILKNSALGEAYVYDVSYVLKSGWGVNFSFLVNNETINGGNFSKNYEKIRNVIINRSFPVIYNQKDPDDNAILITPEDFHAFNVRFPDSLFWLKNILDKKD